MYISPVSPPTHEHARQRIQKNFHRSSLNAFRMHVKYTHTYIYIYIGSGKRAYSALPPFYSPYTASIGDYQRSINRVATFPTFLARYSTVLTTVELEQARFPRSVYLRQTDLGKSWPRIKLIGIRRSLFNVIGEEGERKKKGNEVTSR